MTDIAASLPQFDDSRDFSPDQATPNPLWIIHRALRGRYKYAVALSIVLAIPAALMAHKIVPVRYASVGLVEVQPEFHQTLYRIPENERLQDVSEFTNTQIAYLTNSRVRELAAQNPKLIEAGWPTGQSGVLAVKESLNVFSPRRSRMIRVQVEHLDPRLAQECVNSVLDAYVQLHGETIGLTTTQTQRELTTLIQSLQRELQSSRDAAFRLADEFGADTLERRHLAKLDELDRYDAIIAQYEEALLVADTTEQPSDEIEGDNEPDLALLADEDTQLASLIQSRDEILAQKASLSGRFGENHRTMRRLDENLRSLNTQIDSRVVYLLDLRESQSEDGHNLDTNLDSETLLARLEEFKQARETIREDARELGRRLRQIESLEESAEDTRARLSDAQERLSQLEIEMRNNRNERVVIAQRGDYPLAPSSDKRMPASVVAAFGGIGLSFGVVFLIGFSKPTFRFIDEIEHDVRSLPLLGTLPDYTTGDQTQRELAAHSVHHIRNTMQLHASRQNISTFTITSAAANDGKTSLVMSIGTSYAAAGRRVLLIDCDFVGRGLSRALDTQDEDGLAQVGSGDEAVRLTRSTNVPNLDILPAGQVDHLDAARLSADQLRPVLETLSSRYDIVLIDTGPLMGSLEAGIVCSICDAVILTVSCGQSMKLVNVAVEKLKRSQANCLGLVFNRASPGDFQHSTSHTSVSAHSMLSRSAVLKGSQSSDMRSALMNAVAGTASQTENEQAI
ncbi:MAG: GumC family protein [Planctomycetota bacterium]|jgi:capsular exopolysaccharide synthesis family protein